MTKNTERDLFSNMGDLPSVNLYSNSTCLGTYTSTVHVYSYIIYFVRTVGIVLFIIVSVLSSVHFRYVLFFSEVELLVVYLQCFCLMLIFDTCVNCLVLHDLAWYYSYFIFIYSMYMKLIYNISYFDFTILS